MVITLFKRIDQLEVLALLESFCEARGEPFVLYTILLHEEELKDMIAKEYNITDEYKQRVWDYLLTFLRGFIPDHTGKTDTDRLFERIQKEEEEEDDE